MKKTTPTFLFIFTFFYFALPSNTSGVVNAQEKPKTTQNVTVCKDIDCFIKAAEKCEMATFLHQQKVDLGAEIISKDDQYEIKGGTASKCSLYLKVLKWESVRNETWYEEMKESGKSPREPDPEIVKMTNDRMRRFTGTDGVCTFSTKRLTTLFQRMKANRFSTEDFRNAGCEGSWFVKENGFYKGF